MQEQPVNKKRLLALATVVGVFEDPELLNQIYAAREKDPELDEAFNEFGDEREEEISDSYRDFWRKLRPQTPSLVVHTVRPTVGAIVVNGSAFNLHVVVTNCCIVLLVEPTAELADGVVFTCGEGDKSAVLRLDDPAADVYRRSSLQPLTLRSEQTGEEFVFPTGWLDFPHYLTIRAYVANERLRKEIVAKAAERVTRLIDQKRPAVPQRSKQRQALSASLSRSKGKMGPGDPPTTGDPIETKHLTVHDHWYGEAKPETLEAAVTSPLQINARGELYACLILASAPTQTYQANFLINGELIASVAVNDRKILLTIPAPADDNSQREWQDWEVRLVPTGELPPPT